MSRQAAKDAKGGNLPVTCALEIRHQARGAGQFDNVQAGIGAVGYYIPAITSRTEQRCVGQGAEQRCKIAIQTNNVEVDDRGYIYAADRANTGLHIVELTGPARLVANFQGASDR